MNQQLGLAVSLRDDCQFANFHALAGSSAWQAREFLRDDVAEDKENLAYLWGPSGCGRSHLLQAICHHWADNGRRVQYLPIKDIKDVDAHAVLAGLENVDLVCLDDVDQMAHLPDWQEALFHFLNRRSLTGTCVVVSGDTSPLRLEMPLADLTSRLSAAVTFQLPGYGDEEKIQILRYRAECLGLELSAEAARFLLNHAPRNLAVLIEKLRDLDTKSLVHQRRLSVPFIKQVFNW